MHRFRSKSSIRRFQLAAVLTFVKCFSIPIVAALLLYAIFTDDRLLTLVAIGVGALALILSVLLWLISGHTRCPLCMTPVFGTRRCSKHRHARTVLGSYRLRVALAVIFKRAFRCPYCHEPTAMEVR